MRMTHDCLLSAKGGPPLEPFLPGDAAVTRTTTLSDCLYPGEGHKRSSLDLRSWFESVWSQKDDVD